MNDNKKTRNKKLKVLVSLLSSTDDTSSVFRALFDKGQLEDRFESFTESLRSLTSIISAFKLRTDGQLSDFCIGTMLGEDSQTFEITSTKYNLENLLKEFERFDESVSEVIEAKEQLKLTILEKEKLTSNSSEEEEVPTPFH